MVWKVVLVKTQILETGYSKLNKGFTLLELLVVLLIIGIASSVILINTSSIENVTQSRASIERNFQIISEVILEQAQVDILQATFQTVVDPVQVTLYPANLPNNNK